LSPILSAVNSGNFVWIFTKNRLIIVATDTDGLITRGETAMAAEVVNTEAMNAKTAVMADGNFSVNQ